MNKMNEIKPQFKMFNNDFIDVKVPAIESIPFFINKDYPLQEDIKNFSAVYFLLGEYDEILYIGKANALRTRLASHLSPYIKVGCGSWIPRGIVKKVVYLKCNKEESIFLEMIYPFFYPSKYNNKGYAKQWN